MPYGASPGEWAHWLLELGLGPDLLPVVCEQGLPISPSSKLTAYGKVPSRLTPDGYVVGFPAWTSHHTTDAEISSWMQDDRLGICLQTREVRAFDCDLEDVEEIDKAVGCIPTALPMRTRGNSPRCLFIFRLVGEYPKQVLKTTSGVIECLMNGQQFVACGTHPSGSRYEWLGGLPESIPTLTEPQFRAVQARLRDVLGVGEWSEGRLRRQRDPAQRAAEDDSVAQFLASKDMIVGRAPGRVDFKCPWVTEHSAGTDPTATSYFLPGSGGFETGHAKCLHASHAGKTDRDFMDAIGYTDFFMSQGMEKLEDVPGTLDSLILGVAAPAVTPSPVSGPRFIRADTGAIKVLVKNIVEALRYPEWCGVTVRYDTFRNEVLWGDRPVHDIDTTRLNITLTELGIGPGAIRTEMLESAMALVAHEREFDSAIEWLTPLVWDHTPRCATFCPRYLGTEDTPYHRAVSLYWWTAHAGRVLRPAGVQADSAIILVSTQGTGKTSVTKAMVPLPEHYVEIQLHGDDKDRIRKMRGKLIGELAELSGLKSRDAESIKALISATGDSLVDKYEKHAQDLSRRLVFVGSSNNDDFLSDPTGNRRFYPVYVGDHQDLQAIRRDRDQLWAEAAHLFLAKGEVMWEDAARLVLAEHHKFEDVDSWEEDIIPWLNCPENWLLTDQATQYVRTGKILTEALSIEKGRRSKRDEYRIGRIMARYGCCTKIRVVNSKATKVWVKQDSKENI